MWIEIIRNYFFDHNKSSINGLVIFPYLMYQNDVQYCFIAVFEIYIYSNTKTYILITIMTLYYWTFQLHNWKQHSHIIESETKTNKHRYNFLLYVMYWVFFFFFFFRGDYFKIFKKYQNWYNWVNRVENSDHTIIPNNINKNLKRVYSYIILTEIMFL